MAVASVRATRIYVSVGIVYYATFTDLGDRVLNISCWMAHMLPQFNDMQSWNLTVTYTLT